MAKHEDLAKILEERGIVKAVIGDYIIYRRDWLHNNIEQEYILQKSARDFEPIKDGITRLREFIKEQQEGKK